MSFSQAPPSQGIYTCLNLRPGRRGVGARNQPCGGSLVRVDEAVALVARIRPLVLLRVRAGDRLVVDGFLGPAAAARGARRRRRRRGLVVVERELVLGLVLDDALLRRNLFRLRRLRERILEGPARRREGIRRRAAPAPARRRTRRASPRPGAPLVSAPWPWAAATCAGRRRWRRVDGVVSMASR